MQKEDMTREQLLTELAELRRRVAEMGSSAIEYERRARDLEKNVKQLQDMLDCAPTVIYSKDTRGRYLFINKQTETVFHVDRDAIVGLTDNDVFPADVAEMFRSHDRKVLEAGRPVDFDEEVPQDDGIHYYRSTKFPLCDADGQIAGVCAISTDMTRHKQMEEALWENERKCRAIFDQTFQFIGLLTPDGTVVEANRTAMEFSAVDLSHVLGKPFWDTPWWAHSEELQEQLKEAIARAAAGAFVRLEVTHKARDGSLRDIDFSLKPVRNDEGEVIYLIPEGRDITEHKRIADELEHYREDLESMVEERIARLKAVNRDLEKEMYERKLLDMALQESERKIRTLMGNLPGMAYRCMNDRDWTMEFVSDGCMELTGYESSDLIGNRNASYAELIQEDHRDRVWDTVQTALEDRQRFKMVYRIHARDGRLKWVLEQGIGVFGEDGQLQALEGFISDINDHKLAEEELRRHRDHLEELVEERTADLIGSEEKYRTLVENVPLVTYRISLSGEVLFVNQFVEEIFGYDPDEMFRRPQLLLKDCVCAEDLDMVKELRERSLHHEQEFLAEYRVRHKRGHLVYVMDHAIPFRSPDGRIRGMDGIIMDITSRVRLRDELVRAEEQKTITEVSARLAHEIRNPLVSAGGFARRLLSSMAKDDPNRGKVEIIVKEVRRLETILRMILNYLQPVQLFMSMNNLNQLVENAVSGVDSELQESHIRLQLDLDKELPDIDVDRLQMELVLETLIKQAINEIQDGETLSIATSAGNRMVRLAMTYRVKHVSRDDIEHFFYPFISSEKAYDTADLPQSKIIIHKHGGEIDVTLEKPDTLILKIALPKKQVKTSP